MVVVNLISKLAIIAPQLRQAKGYAKSLHSRLLLASKKFRRVSSKGTIVLLSPGSNKGSNYVASAVDELGFDLVVVSSTFPSWEGQYAKRWISLDPLADYETLLEAVSSANPVAVLVEQRNFLLPIKAKLNRDLNLKPYGDLSYKTSNSKIEMRQAIDRAGLLNPPWCLLEDYYEGALDYPFMVKPEKGTGSRGVTIVENATDLTLARERLEALADDEAVGGRVMLEGQISGRQFDVEGVLSNGTVYPLALIEEHYETIGNAFPMGWYLFSPPVDEDLREKIFEAVGAFVTGLGCINGAFHCEVRLDENEKIFAIDFANRMGYPHLVSAASGHNFPMRYVETMADEPLNSSKIERNCVFQEYIREQTRMQRWLRLINDHPDLLIQKNLLPFQLVGVNILGRIAIRSTDFDSLKNLLYQYDLIPEQWKSYYAGSM